MFQTGLYFEYVFYFCDLKDFEHTFSVLCIPDSQFFNSGTHFLVKMYSKFNKSN